MKKSIVFGIMIVLLLTNVMLINSSIKYRSQINKQVFKVYSFEGQEGPVSISNGIVILSPNKEMVNGGNIQYEGNQLNHLQSYTKTIYLDKLGNKDIILSNSVTFSGNEKGASIPEVLLRNKQVGEISSASLFNENEKNIFKDNLYFTLDYQTIDGYKGSFCVKLKVKELDLREVK